MIKSTVEWLAIAAMLAILIPVLVFCCLIKEPIEDCLNASNELS